MKTEINFGISKETAGKIEMLVILAFEAGKLYQNMYRDFGLENAVDFKDIAYAKSFGAQFKFKGDMSNLPKIHTGNHLPEDKKEALKFPKKSIEEAKSLLFPGVFTR